MSNKEETAALYRDKILGVRNYESEKEEFYVSDFIEKDMLFEFIWEVSTGESDFTPAGISFVNDYYEFEKLAEEYIRDGRQLPPHGEGKTDAERIMNFVQYMSSIVPMELTLLVAQAQWEREGKKGDMPSLETIDERLLPPSR